MTGSGAYRALNAGGAHRIVHSPFRTCRRKISEPSGNPTTFTYDTDDRLAAKQDAENRLTSYTYDALSRPFQVFNTAIQRGALERRSYRPNGQLASLTDARGNVTTYDYDGLDRPARVVLRHSLLRQVNN